MVYVRKDGKILKAELISKPTALDFALESIDYFIGTTNNCSTGPEGLFKALELLKEYLKLPERQYLIEPLVLCAEILQTKYEASMTVAEAFILAGRHATQQDVWRSSVVDGLATFIAHNQPRLTDLNARPIADHLEIMKQRAKLTRMDFIALTDYCESILRQLEAENFKVVKMSLSTRASLAAQRLLQWTRTSMIPYPSRTDAESFVTKVNARKTAAAKHALKAVA